MCAINKNCSSGQTQRTECFLSHRVFPILVTQRMLSIALCILWAGNTNKVLSTVQTTQQLGLLGVASFPDLSPHKRPHTYDRYARQNPVVGRNWTGWEGGGGGRGMTTFQHFHSTTNCQCKAVSCPDIPPSSILTPLLIVNVVSCSDIHAPEIRVWFSERISVYFVDESWFALGSKSRLWNE